MKDNLPLSNDPVDRLVRDHLLREAQSVDAAGILAGVHARSTLAGRPPASFRGRSRWVVRATLAAAAALLLAVLWALPGGLPVANAETIVREVQQAHAGPLELCYQHNIEFPQGAEGETGLPLPPEGRLWTRGDRFFMETMYPNGRLNAWGRDASGRVWYAPVPSAGFRFEASEVPEPLARVADQRTMNVDKLLTELLTHFDLRKVEAAPLLQVVEAYPRPGRLLFPLRFVRLEIDTRQKLLRKVEMHRRQPQGIAHVLFTLVENAPRQPDEKYTLEGHLAEDAQVFSMNHPPPLRYKLLRERYELGRRGGPDFPKFLRGKKP